MSHPFGDLLRQYRERKRGLSQTRLAHMIGYDHAVLVRMSQGKKDLTGPSGRERILLIIAVLCDEGVLATQAEANALLRAAGMPPLFEGQPAEAQLMSRLVHVTPQPSTQARRTNLPAPLVHFIGRERESAEVRRLLGTTRLLTLTGSGGAGKTRLAQHVAPDLPFNFANGVWYAELAPVIDGARVAEVVAAALGLQAADRPAYEQVLDYLRDRQALLVLDNCEHLIDAVAAFTLDLLRACPRVSILATSREALNVEGEVAWRVPPMQPDEATQLFVERAHAVRPDLALDACEAIVAHICRRLDGMPLAIELAAARLQGMSLSELSARLDDRFALLISGRRGTLPRHQTLRAVIDWSYDLLSDPERILFRRLSVFVGDWTAELAGHVCADATGPLPLSSGERAEVRETIAPNDVLPLLLQLVSKSLVGAEAEERDGETRYRYLETIREYALERLAESDELEMAQRRHAEALAGLAERSDRPSRGPQQRPWLLRLEDDHPNLHAALAWSFGPHGDARIGCRIFGNLLVFWTAHSFDAQGWGRLARAALTPEMSPRIRGAVWLISTLFDFYLTPEEALASSRQSLACYTEADDQRGMAQAMGCVGDWMLTIDPHDPEGWRMLEEGVARARAVGDTLVESTLLRDKGGFECKLGEFDRAEATYRETLRLSRETNDPVNLWRVLGQLADLYLDQQRFEAALTCAEEVVLLGRQINDPIGEYSGTLLTSQASRFLGELPRAVAFAERSMALAGDLSVPEEFQVFPRVVLSKALIAIGEYSRAKALLDEALRINQRWPQGPVMGTYGLVYNVMASLAACRDQPHRAALLFGAADTERQMRRGPTPSPRDWEYPPIIAQVRVTLGHEAFEAAYAEGQHMTLEQAVAYALQGSQAEAEAQP